MVTTGAVVVPRGQTGESSGEAAVVVVAAATVTAATAPVVEAGSWCEGGGRSCALWALRRAVDGRPKARGTRSEGRLRTDPPGDAAHPPPRTARRGRRCPTGTHAHTRTQQTRPSPSPRTPPPLHNRPAQHRRTGWGWLADASQRGGCQAARQRGSPPPCNRQAGGWVEAARARAASDHTRRQPPPTAHHARACGGGNLGDVGSTESGGGRGGPPWRSCQAVSLFRALQQPRLTVLGGGGGEGARLRFATTKGCLRGVRGG